jgi:transcriptional regulator with XRE-family HTH domain
MTLASHFGGYKVPPLNTYEPPVIDERQKVGLILRHARKQAELTLSQASELSGLSRSTIGSIERGEHDLGSVTGKNMRNLHAAFGLSRAKFEEIVMPVYNIRASTPFESPSAVEITGYRMMPIYALASAGVDAAEAVPLYDYPPLMFPESSWHPALRMFLAKGHSMDSGREGA